MKAFAIDAYEVPITLHELRVHQVLDPGRAGIPRKASHHGTEYSFLFMRPDGAQLAEIGKLLESGVIRPQIDRVFPLDKTPSTLEQSASGRARGKIVVEGHRASLWVAHV